jgi:hypothetical protein
MFSFRVITPRRTDLLSLLAAIAGVPHSGDVTNKAARVGYKYKSTSERVQFDLGFDLILLQSLLRISFYQRGCCFNRNPAKWQR